MSTLSIFGQKLRRGSTPRQGGSSLSSKTRTLLVKSHANEADVFVFGLAYDTPLLADTRQKELQRFAALNKATRSCFITIKGNDGRNASLMAAGAFQTEKGNNYFAAAAAICQQNKGSERTYLIEVGSNSYAAFQASSIGLLRIGSETIGDAAAITALLRLWQSDRSLGAISFLLSPDAPMLDLVTDGLGVTARAADLLNFKPAPTTLLTKQAAPYAKFALMAFVGVAAIGFAAVKGSDYIQKLNLQKNAANEQQQRRTNYLNQVNQTVASAWTGTHQDVYEFVVLPLMRSVSLKRVGWKISEVTCDIPQRSCSSKWKRVTGNYFEMLSTTTANQVALTEDYDVIQLLERADFDKAKKPPPSFQSLPKRKTFLLDIGDILSEFKLAKMTTAGPIAKSTALVAWSGQEPPPPAPLTGTVKLIGDIGLINAMLVMPPNTTPQKLTLTAGNGSSLSFVLESNYYVSPDN